MIVKKAECRFVRRRGDVSPVSTESKALDVSNGERDVQPLF